MIKSKEDLEKKVLEYSPTLRERVENDPRAKSELEKVAGVVFKTYEPYLHGKANVVGKVGRGLGYIGDAVFWGSAIAAASNPILAPYMLTALLLKKVAATAQIPEAVKSVEYAKKTGDVVGGTRNVAAKAAAYIPGLTIVDRGLGKISEKRMIKRAIYDVDKELEAEEVLPWHTYTAEKLKKAGRYTGVRDRKENIVRAYSPGEDVLAERTAEGNLRPDFSRNRALEEDARDNGIEERRKRKAA